MLIPRLKNIDMTRYENNGIILSDKLKACVSSAPMFFHCFYTVYRVNREKRHATAFLA